MIANNFIIYVRLPYFRLLLIILIYDVFYVRIFVEIFVLSNRKMYNFRVDFYGLFHGNCEIRKNYDLFNLKFLCIKESLIFADAVD